LPVSGRFKVSVAIDPARSNSNESGTETYRCGG
jgi:hypothetical protein